MLRFWCVFFSAAPTQWNQSTILSCSQKPSYNPPCSMLCVHMNSRVIHFRVHKEIRPPLHSYPRSFQRCEAWLSRDFPTHVRCFAFAYLQLKTFFLFYLQKIRFYVWDIISTLNNVSTTMVFCFLLGELRQWTHFGLATGKIHCVHQIHRQVSMTQNHWLCSVLFTHTNRHVIDYSTFYTMDRSALFQFCMHSIHRKNKHSGKWWTCHTGNALAYQNICTSSTSRQPGKLYSRLKKPLSHSTIEMDPTAADDSVLANKLKPVFHSKRTYLSDARKQLKITKLKDVRYLKYFAQQCQEKMENREIAPEKICIDRDYFIMYKALLKAALTQAHVLSW